MPPSRSRSGELIPPTRAALQELCASLKKPRRVMLLVKAGKPVDDFMELVIPYLEEGDIIIDGGNSHFPDSIRR